MAPDPGPLWNHRGGQQRLGYSSLEFLTDLAAAFGPKRVFSSVEWVMKLISKKNGHHSGGHELSLGRYGPSGPGQRSPGPPHPPAGLTTKDVD
jgi:hypothetical protein